MQDMIVVFLRFRHFSGFEFCVFPESAGDVHLLFCVCVFPIAHVHRPDNLHSDSRVYVFFKDSVLHHLYDALSAFCGRLDERRFLVDDHVIACQVGCHPVFDRHVVVSSDHAHDARALGILLA